MKIKPMRSGKSEFMRVYRKVFDEVILFQKSDPSRLYNLRCSQLPYCPRSVLINHAHKPGLMSLNMQGAFYVSVGTTVHTVMQSYLSQSGQFLADYECKECGTKYPLSHSTECCGFPTSYEEVTIDVGTKNGKHGIQGHIDGILKDSRGRYWIVDFKTASKAGADSKEKSPGEGYKRQVRAYAVLLKKQYKIRVAGVMLVFIPRDNPRPENIRVWESLMSDKDFEHGVLELKADKKLHRRTMNASSIEEVLDLFKTKCGSPYCEHCKIPKAELPKVAKRILPKLPIIKEHT